MSVSTRSLRIAAPLLTLAVLAPLSFGSEIIDDPTPMGVGNLVLVGVYNPEDISSRGRIEVTATLVDGTTVSKSVPFELDARESDSFEVAFKGEVDEIVDVQITEGPDPIPH